MSISSYWVPGEADGVGRVGRVGGVSRNLRDVLSVGGQVGLVIPIWNRELRVLILDGDTVGSAAAVGNLQLPPPLHLKDLGTVGRDGWGDQTILHVPGDELPQSCHLGLGERVDVAAGDAVGSGDHLDVGVHEAVVGVDVLVDGGVHVLHVVVPHGLVHSESLDGEEEGRQRRGEEGGDGGVHAAVESAVVGVEDDGSGAPGDVGVVGAQPAHPQDDGEERGLSHIQGQHLPVVSQVDDQLVRLVDDGARCYGAPVDGFHQYRPVLDPQRNGVAGDVLVVDEVAGGTRVNHGPDNQGVSARDVDLEHHLQVR
uniref:Uncharacterized protein n=1 Tax=Pipistrellus kuhlii TaxID=59472 RepID=A0A7J7WLI5_PIPKU|nr:hypothetical protein mPipKuh1_007964 [Pipistrellus kuhlii]